MIRGAIKYAVDVLWALQRIARAQEERARIERGHAIASARGILEGTWATDGQRAEARALLADLGVPHGPLRARGGLRLGGGRGRAPDPASHGALHASRGPGA